MSFWDSFFRRTSSGDTAKDRLKFVLVTDRASCSPETMEMIKNDIIRVISKYMVIDTKGLDIQITQTESAEDNGRVPAICANIPIRKINPVGKGDGSGSQAGKAEDKTGTERAKEVPEKNRNKKSGKKQRKKSRSGKK